MNTAEPRLLVVEDDLDVARLICRSLGEFGFACDVAASGRAALDAVRTRTPELTIVDLGLPDMDGLALIAEMQRLHPCAVLILTGRAGVADRVLGLELGADDYLVKPFEPRELVARVRSILRRYQKTAAPTPASQEGCAHFAGWRYDPASHTLTDPQGGSTRLSTAEAQLLMLFLAHPNRILSRERLVGDRPVESYDRSIDVRISRLRRKLRDDPHDPRLIKTVYGAGYLFAAPVRWE